MLSQNFKSTPKDYLRKANSSLWIFFLVNNLFSKQFLQKKYKGFDLATLDFPIFVNIRFI